MTNQTSGRLIAGIVGIFLLTSVSLAFSGSVTVSWDANTEADLEGYKVYYGLESRNYSEVLDVGNANSVAFSELNADRTYFFSVTAYDLTGNESPFSDEVSAAITATDGGGDTDTTRPAVVAVVTRGETQIDLIFSEPVDKSSAENIANYSISNGVTVIGAILDADPTVVHLITSAHTRAVDHILIVRNVADVNGNTVDEQNTKTYNIPDPAQDTRAPELLYVAVKSETLLEVIFNESVRFAEAEDVGNYSISDGIPILQAKLRTNQSIVELTTSAHAPGTDYTLTVSDIKDLAGNLIGDQNSFSYRTVAKEEDDSRETDTVSPRLVAISVRGQTQVDLSFNEPVKRTSAENPANYFINKDIEIKGAILSENQTTVHLVTSNHEFNFEYTVAISGVQDLAGNTISGDASATYTLASDEGPSTNTSYQTPTSFSLFQNYPNPFNPETEIRFFLDEERKIELKVYNQLGQVVKTLVQNSMSTGFHTIVWDGTNNEGNEVPSGVYIYSLEVTRNVLRGELLVNVSLERRVKRMTLIR